MTDSNEVTRTAGDQNSAESTKERLLKESIKLFLDNPGVPEEWKAALTSNKNLTSLLPTTEEEK